MFIRDKYEKMIPRGERDSLERALEMGQGYLLDFSDRTFNDFFYETIGIDPEDQPQLFNGRGISKAKRLRSFIELGRPAMVAKILRQMWEYRDAMEFKPSEHDEDKLREAFFSIVARLEGHADVIDTSAIETFEPNVTLEELVASIWRDLDAKKPQAALPRQASYLLHEAVCLPCLQSWRR